MCWLVLVCPVVSVGGGGEPSEGLVWPVGVVFMRMPEPDQLAASTVPEPVKLSFPPNRGGLV